MWVIGVQSLYSNAVKAHALAAFLLVRRYLMMLSG